MGHRIAAVIVKGGLDAGAVQRFDLKSLPLPQGLSLLALDQAYCDHWADALRIPGFLSDRPLFNCLVVHHMVQAASPGCRFAVIETEYFGGVGEQWAAVYEGSTTLMQPTGGDIGPINEALRLLGLRASAGRDEFDAAELHRWRQFDDLFEAYR